ncbi:MAG: hypothetical protein H8D23_30960 [Candidatus Brocadiales bacterium]|nr:hypothetical protein [Candidatus Brocadiales bacterium]
MKLIKTKLFLFTTIIIMSFSSVCIADMHGEGVSIVSNPVNDEELMRDPFALPLDVNFLKKSLEAENTDSDSGEWTVGMVASNVKGIFRSNGRTIANINHVWVETGKWVGEEQVTAINRDSVVLSGVSGVERTLLMQEDGARFETTTRIISKIQEKK